MDRKWTPAARTWIVICVLLLLGTVGFIYTITHGIAKSRTAFQRFDAPGEADLTLTAPGTYTIFLEMALTEDSLAVQRPESAHRLRFYLMEEASQQRIALQPPAVDQGYSIQRTVGEPLYDFTVGRPGVYQLTTSYPAEEKGAAVQLALRQTYGNQVVGVFLKGLMVLVLSWALAAAALARDYRLHQTAVAATLVILCVALGV